MKGLHYLIIYFMMKRISIGYLAILLLIIATGCTSKYVHSYESCGSGLGAFTLHSDGSATHQQHGTKFVKGTWSADGDVVTITGIPDYSGTYVLDGENDGIALKSRSTGRRFCSEY